MKNFAISKNKISNGARKLLQIGLVSLAAVLVTLPVFAATLSLSPANVSVKQGQKFNAVVKLDPQGVKNYTAKVELKYPANLLEVKSFSFGSNLMPLSQTGYDLVDNAGGTLVKTAGFPGGLISPATFGTVTFTAKASGTGAVTVGSNTQVLDASNGNVLSGSSQVSVIIGAVAGATPKPTGSVSVSPSPSATPSLSISPAPERQAVSQGGLFATIGNIVSLGTGSVWLGILVIVIIVIVLIYFLAIRKKKSGGF